MSTAQAALIVSGLAAVISLFATINAVRALRWQRRRDQERRAVPMRLSFDHFAGHKYVVTVSAINESGETTVYVRTVQIVEARGGGRIVFGSNDPDVRLEPRQRVSYETIVD